MAYTTSTTSVIALAGLFQSTALVHRLATQGVMENSDFEHCVNSLFVIQPHSVSDIFSPDCLHTGFKSLASVLDRSTEQGQNYILKYVLSLVQLEIKLQKNKGMVDTIRQRIRQIDRQKTYFEKNNQTIPHCEPVIASLAFLYRESISTLSPKIHVIGQPQHLQTESITNKIRTLLLSGIRAATLWRQLGGKRWHFIFFRKRMLETIRQQAGYNF